MAGNMVDTNGVTRTYNAANQMINDGTNTLTYDNNGNLTGNGTDTYTWDRANRLSSVGNHSYVYDGLGNRVQQTVSSVVTDYLNDVQPGLTKLLKQTTGANVEQFVHAPRGIHAVDDGTDWNFYAQDGLGSVRSIVDDGAVVQSSMSFDPYGNPMASYGAGFGFTGEQTDANDSVFLRARYYEPEKGIFSALDPVELPNRYQYVAGNPINLTDPTGLNPFAAVTPACAAFVLGDGPLPIGDAICLTMLAAVGISGLWALFNTQRTLGGVGTGIHDPAITSANIDAFINNMDYSGLPNPDNNDNPEPEPQLEPRPWGPIPPTDTLRRRNERCKDRKTKNPPRDRLPFADAEDLLDNLACYTGLTGPYTASFFRLELSLVHIQPVTYGSLGGGAVGEWRNPNEVTGGGLDGTIYISNAMPGGPTRGDVLAVLTEEIRHAAQYWDEGDVPPCNSLTYGDAERDAKMYMKQWQTNSKTWKWAGAFTKRYSGWGTSIDKLLVEYAGRAPVTYNSPIPCGNETASSSALSFVRNFNEGC